MTARQRRIYESERRALCSQQATERSALLAAQASESVALANQHKAQRKELEAKQQRDWFELRDRLGMPIGPAGHSILEKAKCTSPTK